MTAIPANFRDRVAVNIKDAVAEVRLARPDKRNALDNNMFKAIVEAGEAVKAAAGLRVVVLYGEGASFCAGLDFDTLSKISAGDDGGFSATAGHVVPDAIANHAQRAAWIWQEVPVPVIAAVHGHALGGGFQIAMGADIRIVHPETQLSVREMYWGLFPDMTGTFTVARHVRPDVAKELIFTARIFSGQEGYELGVVTKLSSDPLADARAMAAQIANSNPEAIVAAKLLLNQITNAGAAQQLASERAEIVKILGRPNQAEAVMANFEKRKPTFTDLT